MELVKTRIADDLSFNTLAPRPPDALQRLYTASDSGRFSAKSLLKLNQEPERLIESCEHYLRDHLRNAINSDASQPEAWQQLYQAGFWFKCSAIFQQFVVLEHDARSLEIQTGVRLQQALTQALIGVHEDDRCWIWNQFQRKADNGRSWRGHVVGATAVARAATCLHAVCERVALPTIDLDLRYKIDLVAELTTDPQLLVCVQVKHARHKLPHVEILSLNRHMRSPTWVGDPEWTAIGMANFNRNHFVNWVPLFIRVGTECLPIRAIEPLPLLHAALKETLQSL